MKHTYLLASLLLPALVVTQSPKPATPALGSITGQLTYPSDYFPDNMRVTAVPVSGQGQVYTTTRTSGERYRLRLPAGRYYVYATTKDFPGYKAYYTKFVTCGLKYSCPSHAKIVVHIKAGITLARIDPEDWYVPDPQPAAVDSIGQ